MGNVPRGHGEATAAEWSLLRARRLQNAQVRQLCSRELVRACDPLVYRVEVTIADRQPRTVGLTGYPQLPAQSGSERRLHAGRAQRGTQDRLRYRRCVWGHHRRAVGRRGSGGVACGGPSRDSRSRGARKGWRSPVQPLNVGPEGYELGYRKQAEISHVLAENYEAIAGVSLVSGEANVRRRRGRDQHAVRILRKVSIGAHPAPSRLMER